VLLLAQQALLNAQIDQQQELEGNTCCRIPAKQRDYVTATVIVWNISCSCCRKRLTASA
jgi:hypothetical protein